MSRREEKLEACLIEIRKKLLSEQKRWCGEDVSDPEEMWVEYPENIIIWLEQIEEALS